jgi:hypothetical protein
MKTSELRNLIREEVRKVIKEANVAMSGDYNDSDFDGPAKKASLAYLKTPEGMKAAKILKSLVTNQFDAFDLEKAIKACNFKKMNDFKAAAKAGGLEIDGLGNVDNEGNGDFEVMSDTYTDQGVAIAFRNNKLFSVG